MKLNDFDYSLPQVLIATEPASPRDHSKLLILDKKTGRHEHRHFFDIVDYLLPGDVLVVNDSKVFPARLLGKKVSSGGKVELLLNKKVSDDSSGVILGPDPGIQDSGCVWEVLGKNVKTGSVINFDNSLLEAEVMTKYDEVCEVRFNLSGDVFFAELEKIGHTPLPPYIKRADNKTDRREYQTVYANKTGSAAAPTAGLHFTKQLLEKINSKGITLAKVTLNVGLGTFAPVKEEQIEDHKIHSEHYQVDKNELKKIVDAKREGRRIIAVGTTTTRVLEHVFSQLTTDLPTTDNLLSGWTNIFIYPGYKFKCVNGMITNFHLPKSTLLLLVSAFAGKSNVDAAYEEAINKKYRFYSYGDAMLII